MPKCNFNKVNGKSNFLCSSIKTVLKKLTEFAQKICNDIRL